MGHPRIYVLHDITVKDDNGGGIDAVRVYDESQEGQGGQEGQEAIRDDEQRDGDGNWGLEIGNILMRISGQTLQ